LGFIGWLGKEVYSMRQALQKREDCQLRIEDKLDYVSEKLNDHLEKLS
jgi:hypothetical protein